MTQKIEEALWRIYKRPSRPALWQNGGNLPWDDPDFSQRMLREHLDESHGAATRQMPERMAQIDWLWQQLALQPGQHLLDATCGPGLYAVEMARRGLLVTGIDFAPASIDYAKELAEMQGVHGRTTFILQDIRHSQLPPAHFDAAILLYGQLAVFPRQEAQAILQAIAHSLKPGGRLCVELLNRDKVDKMNSSWWYTDDSGLWGDAPYLHLGERFWDAESQASLERYQILHLESGQLDEIILCDQTYAVDEMKAVMRTAGFTAVSHYPAWNNLPLYDAEEWIVYVAKK
ncbi:MAG: class I SAM-dependent methyltransferase [Candidatus Promineifilaceae bacterium]